MTSDIGSAFDRLAQEFLGQLHETIHDAVLSALDHAGLVVPFAAKERKASNAAVAEKPATTTGWTAIPEATFKSGRVSRTIRPKSPVKVKGLGRGGGIGSGYVVTGLESRNGDVNVHVRKGREQERTVKLERIIYVIPRKPSELGTGQKP